MVKPFSEEAKQKWHENVLKQRASGLSISPWCHQNGIAVHSFYYWRDKLFPKTPLDHSTFTEIIDKKDISATDITLEYQTFKIHLRQHFDSSTLKRCLEVIKKC